MPIPLPPRPRAPGAPMMQPQPQQQIGPRTSGTLPPENPTGVNAMPTTAGSAPAAPFSAANLSKVPTQVMSGQTGTKQVAPVGTMGQAAAPSPLAAQHPGNITGGLPAAGGGFQAPHGGDGVSGAATTVSNMYQPLIDSLNKSWGNEQQNLQGQMAGFQRRADIMNARMGRSIGGGYASLAGGALGKGMEAYRNAASDYQKNLGNLGFHQAQDTLSATNRLQDIARDETHRTTERGWQLQDQAHSDTQHYIDQYLSMNDDVSQDMVNKLMSAKSPEDVKNIIASDGSKKGTTTVDVNGQKVTGGFDVGFKITGDNGTEYALSSEEANKLVTQLNDDITGMGAPGVSSAAMQFYLSYQASHNGQKPSDSEVADYLRKQGMAVNYNAVAYGVKHAFGRK